MLFRYSVAFAGLLDSFITNPYRKSSLLKKRKDSFGLKGYGCGKIPGTHHVDIIFATFYCSYLFGVFDFEIVAELVAHKKAYGVSDGIGLIACQPFFYDGKQAIFVFCEYLRIQ